MLTKQWQLTSRIFVHLLICAVTLLLLRRSLRGLFVCVVAVRTEHVPVRRIRTTINWLCGRKQTAWRVVWLLRHHYDVERALAGFLVLHLAQIAHQLLALRTPQIFTLFSRYLANVELLAFYTLFTTVFATFYANLLHFTLALLDTQHARSLHALLALLECVLAACAKEQFAAWALASWWRWWLHILILWFLNLLLVSAIRGIVLQLKHCHAAAAEFLFNNLFGLLIQPLHTVYLLGIQELKDLRHYFGGLHLKYGSLLVRCRRSLSNLRLVIHLRFWVNYSARECNKVYNNKKLWFIAK